jgi:hypothetical protein
VSAHDWHVLHRVRLRVDVARSLAVCQQLGICAACLLLTVGMCAS